MDNINKKETIQELIDKRNAIIKKVRELEKTYNDFNNLCDSLDSGISGRFPYTISYQTNMEKGLKNLDSKCWNILIKGCGFHHLISSDRYDELLKESESIPFTEMNIESFFESVNKNRSKEFDIFIKETYKNFTSTHYGNWRQRKQDNCNKINSNFRLSLRINREIYCEHFKVAYNDYRLNNLEKVFYILDGKTPAKYPDTIQDKINNSKKYQDVFNNEYFEIKLYKNGNQKIIIKRLDILEKLNKYGSDKSTLHNVDKKIFN